MLPARSWTFAEQSLQLLNFVNRKMQSLQNMSGETASGAGDEDIVDSSATHKRSNTFWESHRNANRTRLSTFGQEGQPLMERWTNILYVWDALASDNGAPKFAKQVSLERLAELESTRTTKPRTCQEIWNAWSDLWDQPQATNN